MAGIIWMFVVSLLLFWLPGIGPVIAGIVGGIKSGGVGNAILAALLPGIVFGFLLFSLATLLSGLPVVGVIAGAGGVIVALFHVGPMLLGAIVGGLLA